MWRLANIQKTGTNAQARKTHSWRGMSGWRVMSVHHECECEILSANGLETNSTYITVNMSHDHPGSGCHAERANAYSSRRKRRHGSMGSMTTLPMIQVSDVHFSRLSTSAQNTERENPNSSISLHSSVSFYKMSVQSCFKSCSLWLEWEIFMLLCGHIVLIKEMSIKDLGILVSHPR